MSYALLWIELLSIAVLWMAFTSACLSRVKWRRLRGYLVGIAWALPLLWFASWAYGAGAVHFMAKVENNWFAGALGLFVADCLGIAIIGIMARPPHPGMAPRAVTWPRMVLAAGWVVSVLLMQMTAWNLDMAVRARASILAVEADALWLATAPAVVSEEQNAGPLYEKAFARLDNDSLRGVENSPIGMNATFDPKEPATVAYLTRQASTLELLRKAAAMPCCRFEDDLTVKSFEKFKPPINGERMAANVLSLDSRRELAEGRVPNAIADVAAIFRMSRHFMPRPGVMAGMVAVGVDAVAASALQEILPAVSHPREIADLSPQALGSLRRMSWRTFQSEERLMLDFLGAPQHVGGEGSEVAHSLAAADPLLHVVLVSDELDAWLEVIDTCKQATRQQYFKIAQEVNHVEEKNRATHAHKGMFTSILAPSVTRSLQAIAKGEASDACVEIALAMTRYRLDHGSLPDHLPDLVPAYLDSVPLDPFDGQPLRLIVKDNRWIIYSVGTSGKDAGSQTTPDWKKGYVVFVLKASAPATTRP
jgi:hypothetical protein